MDVRDIPIPTTFPKGRTIPEIFRLQGELLDEYLKVEKLEKYPFPIDSPKHQIILKDFIARVVEELGEAFQSYEIMLIHQSEEKTENKYYTPHIFNFNEELADALHFFVETMIVTGMTPDTILHYTERNNTTPPNREHNWHWDHYELLGYNNIPLHRIVSPGFLLADSVIEAEKSYLGGLYLSQRVYDDMAMGLWDITYKLQLARNTLKNKPWKQTHMKTDEDMFFNYMVEAFNSLMRFTRSVGISEEGLYTLYFRKNEVNKFRIRSKY